MSHDEDILTLNDGGEALEEEVECELEDESVGPTCAWRLGASEARPSPITRSDGFVLTLMFCVTESELSVKTCFQL